MRTLSLLLLSAFALPVLGSSPDPKRLAVPLEDQLKAQELVRQLGSDEYEQRESAHNRLAKMGRLAKPALVSAVNTHPDPEVRSRCRELLPAASAEDLKARLATFLADTDGKYEHDLPGWNEFKAVAGATPASRQLFNEMMTDPTNRTLLLAVGGSTSELGLLVSNRKTEMYNWRLVRPPTNTRRDATPLEIATLLFAESFVETHKVPRTVAVSTLFISPGFNVAVTESTERGAAMRAIVVKWLQTRDEPAQMYQAMTAATNMGLKEAALVAAKLINSGGTTLYRLYAAYAIARHDAKQHADALEKALDDRAAQTSLRVVNGVQERIEYQVRDAALAALLMLSGQNTEDYGFVEQYRGTAAATSTARYSYSARSLPDSSRDAAFAKWKAWREKNPDWAKNKK